MLAISPFLRSFSRVPVLLSLSSRGSVSYLSKCSIRQIHMDCSKKSDSRGALIGLEDLDRRGKTSQCSSANHWEKRSLMESKLRSGTTLIVDRYSFSGVAFSSAKGLDVEWCKQAAERGGYGGERYEKLEFQKRVAQLYKTLNDAK